MADASQQAWIWRVHSDFLHFGVFVAWENEAAGQKPIANLG
jgi:hypothetical protein